MMEIAKWGQVVSDGGGTGFRGGVTSMGGGTSFNEWDVD